MGHTKTNGRADVANGPELADPWYTLTPLPDLGQNGCIRMIWMAFYKMQIHESHPRGSD